RNASISFLQRKLKIGYNRAARIVEELEQQGIVGPSDGTSRPREVFIDPI
ncbi:MAG: DNA translocase FtsK, partial [Myxococcota bacterium]|nr:DNA translocase FtsK [Myxococcota bacterium]